MATLFPWILLGLALIFTGSSAMLGSADLVFNLLRYIVLFNGGIQGIWAAIGHLFFPEKSAKSIGWTSCGFQTEIGGTNAAIGIVSVLAFFETSWLVPVGLIIAIFFTSCVYVHIYDRVVNKNNAPCNSGPMLYNTVLVTGLLYLLAILVWIRAS